MIAPWLHRAATGAGRIPARLAMGGCALGVAAVLGAVSSGRARDAVACLAASWLFFAGLAAGGVAVAAAVCVAEGGWAAAALPVAQAGGGFFWPALALLAIVAPGLGAVLPWHATAERGDQAWFVARLLASGLLVFGAGDRFLLRSRDPRAAPGQVRAAAVAYLLAALAGLSLWAWGMAADGAAGPTFTAVPAWYVVGSGASGLAWIALATSLGGAASAELRHDLGKLLFALVLLWGYLLWSIYLPTWYGALPDERAILHARWSGGWRPVTVVVLLAVAGGPFLVLFTERGKRGRGTLAIASSAVLAGIWAERHLLVLPTLAPSTGMAQLGIALGVGSGVAGLFVLCWGARLASDRSASIGPAPPPRASALG